MQSLDINKKKDFLHNIGIIILTVIIMFFIFYGYVEEVLSVPNDVTIQVSTVEIDGTTIDDTSLVNVIARIKDSVVEINTTFDVGSGAGSGVIIAKDDTHSYIVTNHHVIDDANTITVILTNGNSYLASLVGSDPQGDIAVVKIATIDTTLAVFGLSNQLQVGETAIVIGNPLGQLGGTVTTGIISALDREIEVEGNVMTLLQTNAQINSGNSGGGLFNGAGLLMGIVNAKSFGTGIEGIGFAIPSNTAKDIVVELIGSSTSITYGFVSGRISLGAELLEINSTNFYEYQNGINRMGVWVTSLSNNSNAKTAGIKINDKMYSLNGTIISSVQTINEIVGDCSMGDSLSVVVVRDGVQILCTVVFTQYIYTV